LATMGRMTRRTTRRDQSPEGYGRSLSSACDIPTPDFLALSDLKENGVQPENGLEVMLKIDY